MAWVVLLIPFINTHITQAVAYCEAQGVDVVKLALWFSLFSDERVPTTLVSTASSSM